MKKIFCALCAIIAFSVCSNAESVKLKITREGAPAEIRAVELKDMGNFQRLEIPASSITPDMKSMEILPDFASAKIGEDGYIVLPNGMLATFRDRPDTKYINKRPVMPLSGMKTHRKTFAAIVSGMQFDYVLKTELKKGVYTLSHIFNFDRYAPYENIVVDYYFLEGGDANYSAMARVYRDKQLDSKTVVPLRERVKELPEVAYAAASPEIRIRQAWKPAPSPVPDQNLKNEPALVVKVTFARVGEIVDALKRAGVEKAEICLVGWNRKGHDGRYPQIFPVEPELGGEAGLRELIKKTQAAGYQIVCHTNSTSAYPVSEIWDTSYISKKKDGTPWQRELKYQWSGGNSYYMCLKQSFEEFAVKDFPKVRDLGFKGMHYMDVLSCVSPHVCYDKNHPTNASESAYYQNKIMGLARKTFGGAQSEGPYDHVAANMDYALYISFNLFREQPAIVDRLVPIWQLVYNGIILSNPSSETVNYPIKGRDEAVKVAEFNGRPTFYYYSAFYNTATGAKNWMGDKDLLCGTPEEFETSIKAIKSGWDDIQKLGYLQYEFMESHEMLAPQVFKTEFSDGSAIVSNYSEKPFEYDGSTIAAKDYKLFKPSLWEKFLNLF